MASETPFRRPLACNAGYAAYIPKARFACNLPHALRFPGLAPSGSNPARHQVLELAAVIEDTRHPRPLAELPAFRRVVRHPEYAGTAGAIALDARLFEELARKAPNPELCTPAELLPQLRDFLLAHGFRPE